MQSADSSFIYDGDLTLNERDDDVTRLRKAKQWLKDNPKEKKSTAIKIYKLKQSTLYSSCSRPEGCKRSG
jgi:hypothetical protein